VPDFWRRPREPELQKRPTEMLAIYRAFPFLVLARPPRACGAQDRRYQSSYRLTKADPTPLRWRPLEGVLHFP
jgi:hypothetical protein